MNHSENLHDMCINAIRFLSVDAIEKAKSGHPGMPMGAASMAYTLWMRHLKHNPSNPAWPDRDRFVLSSGHASMLLYSLLYLTGYDLSLDDLKAFRQWGSKTPGHPEYGQTPGVEVTTGPLGQGLANAVGMAMAEAHMAAKFNRPGHIPVDHHTYVIASDGDLMEGVVMEACALAGHLRLGKLIVLYDNNQISLAGSTALTFTEDIPGRFSACGWQVIQVGDGNDVDAIDEAIRKAKENTNQPSLISVHTRIGFGSPAKEGTADAHGSPLGQDEVIAAKERLSWPAEPAFYVPDEVLAHYRSSIVRGVADEEQWRKHCEDYRKDFPDLAGEFERVLQGDLPDRWEDSLPVYKSDAKPAATRKTGEEVMQSLAAAIPELIGGSADLNPSTFTWLKNYGDFQWPGLNKDSIQGAVGGEWGYGGRNLHFGVREHAMGSISVGMALHGGVIPYTATFFMFADYMRPPIRLAALMGIRVIFIFTHDSIGVGEDGPTHQPVEHLMSLRMIPDLMVIRPADAAETVEAWRLALLNNAGPTALILSRQNLPGLNRDVFAAAEGVRRGGYI
ncbi:MAG: transketolase, partial [Syntrophobacterales bacterium]|nr:transketolase [Syntrophobacterales bacterium]